MFSALNWLGCLAAAMTDSVSGPHAVRLDDRTVVMERPEEQRSFRVITREELAGGRTLAELLAELPGVEVQRAGGAGGYAEVRLRLCPSSQVQVTLDGVPLGGSDGSTVDVGNIAVDGLERVEVLQGGGLGGNEHPEIRLVSRRGFGRSGASVGTGSFGELSGSLWWGDSSGRWSLSGWGQRSENDWPIRWDRGTVYNTADDTTLHLRGNDYQAAGAAVSWRPTGEISADLRGDVSDKGISGLYVSGHRSRYARQAVQLAVASQGTERWDFPWEVTGRLHRTHWEDTGCAVDYRSNRESEELGWEVSAGAGAVGRAGNWWDPWAHLAVKEERSDWETTTPGRVFVTPGASRFTGAFETGWKGKNPSGTLGASLQGTVNLARDDRDFSTAPMRGDVIPSNDSSWSRAGWEMKTRLWTGAADNFWQLWLSGSGASRSPDFFELYGNNGLTFQNLSLKPERSWTAELGGRLNGSGWTAGVIPWVADYEDPIRREMIGATPASRYHNDSGYVALGVDADGAITSRCGRLRLQGTCMRSWIRSAYAAVRGNEMERMPDWKTSLAAESPSWRGFSVEYGFSAQGEMWTSALNLAKEPRRELHGVRLHWRGRFLTLLLSCENLLDEQFADWIDAPLSGRSWHLRADMDFMTLKRKE